MTLHFLPSVVRFLPVNVRIVSSKQNRLESIPDMKPVLRVESLKFIIHRSLLEKGGLHEKSTSFKESQTYDWNSIERDP